MPKKGKGQYCFNDPKTRCEIYLKTDCINYVGQNLPNINVATNDTLTAILISLNDLFGSSDAPPSDELVKVSLNDTIGGFLNGKLVEGSGISLTENNNGGNETLSVTNTAPDQIVTLTQGSNITITGTYPNFTIAASGGGLGTDELIKVSSNDTTAGYLNGKLISGTGITLTENNDGGNETLSVIHADTSSVTNLDTTGAQVIDTLTFDTFGHVQTITTRNLTPSDIGVVDTNFATTNLTFTGNRVHSFGTNSMEYDFTGSSYQLYISSATNPGIETYMEGSNFTAYNQVFGGVTSATWSEYTSGGGGNQYILNNSSNAAQNFQIGSSRIVAGVNIDFRQEANNAGTNANSFWLTHRELWAGAIAFTNTEIKMDDEGIALRTSQGVVAEINYKGLLVDVNSNIRFHNYPNTRDDGDTGKALFISNASGDVVYGDITPAAIGAEVPLTFNNGLTRTSNTVQLGGSLIQVTSIDIGSNNLFTITRGPESFIEIDTTTNLEYGEYGARNATNANFASSFHSVSNVDAQFVIEASSQFGSVDINGDVNASIRRIVYTAADHRFFGNVGFGTLPSTVVHIDGVGGFRYVDTNQAADKILRSDANGVASWVTISSLISAYSTIQEEGSPLTQRATLNFIGDDVTAADDAGNSRTNVTIVSYKRFATFTINASDSEDTIDSHYDYTCDGTADEVQINQAITDLPSTGGRILLSEGTFTIAATITIAKDNVVIEGQGQNTKIILANATNVNAVTIGSGATPFVNITVKNLIIDGNKANQTTAGHGVLISAGAARTTIENCRITDTFHHNISDNASVGARIIGNYLNAPGSSRYNIDFSGSAAVIHGNRCIGGTTGSILVDSVLHPSGVTVSNNICEPDSSTGSGIVLAGWQAVCVGNTVTDFGVRGINANVPAEISGNIVQQRNGAGTTCIRIQSSDPMLCTGNTIFGYDNVTAALTGILVDGADSSTITGNNIQFESTTTPNHIGISINANKTAVTGNVITQYQFTGTAIQSSIGMTFNTITGNVVTGFDVGINVTSSSDCGIRSNHIDCNAGIIGTGASNLVIADNSLTANSGTRIGISLQNAALRTVTITGNSLFGFDGEAMSLVKISKSTVSNNIMVDCGGTQAVLIDGDSTYNTFVGNTISHAGTITYGFREDSSSDGPNTYVGNIVLNWVTAGISTQHTGSQLGLNITS